MKINWTAAITWLAIFMAAILFWGWIVSKVFAAGQPCNWDSDCGYNEMCVPVKRGWATPRMCVERP